MHKRSRFKSSCLATSAVLLLVGGGSAWWSAAQSRQQWPVVKVELPASDEIFPPGPGAESAASHCLICHSAGMILRQPPLTKDEWRAEIMKMRSAFGAPVPEDQVDGLTEYLWGINGLAPAQSP
jgi:mono/diheme cytochrome c family protein